MGIKDEAHKGLALTCGLFISNISFNPHYVQRGRL